MKAFELLAILAAGSGQPPFVDQHPFKDDQIALNVAASQLNSVHVHHEEQYCKSAYRILLDVVVSAAGEPIEVSIADPGCKHAIRRAEFLKSRIAAMPPHRFKKVDQPTRFRLKVTVKWPEYAPAD
jgi:hypothetical protein